MAGITCLCPLVSWTITIRTALRHSTMQGFVIVNELYDGWHDMGYVIRCDMNRLNYRLQSPRHHRPAVISKCMIKRPFVKSTVIRPICHTTGVFTGCRIDQYSSTWCQLIDEFCHCDNDYQCVETLTRTRCIFPCYFELRTVSIYCISVVQIPGVLR